MTQVGRPPSDGASLTSKSASRAFATAGTVRGADGMPHSARVTTPLVCLAPWLVPGTRTWTHRCARSAGAGAAATYGADRMSTTTPLPAAATNAGTRSGRQKGARRPS